MYNYVIIIKEVSNLKKITELRKSLTLSQYELAEKLEISQQTISKYELGLREPDNSTLIKIASFFNVSIDYLLEYSSPKNLTIPLMSDEEKDLIRYYRQLSTFDTRWIMGQIIDLIKKSQSDTSEKNLRKLV